MKVFFPIIFKTYTENAIKRTFEKCGISFESETYYTPASFYEDEFLEKKIEFDCKKVMATHIFTINYFPIISICAAELGIPYISWSYDSPLNLPVLDTMDFDTNRIYLFDKAEVEYYKNHDIENVFHLPLAVDCGELSKIKRPESKKYDVSFLGGFYENDFQNILAPLSQNTREILSSTVKDQVGRPGSDIIDSIVTEFIIKKINNEYYDATEKAAERAHLEMPENVFEINERQLKFLMAVEATRQERLVVTGTLASYYPTAIATGSYAESLKRFIPAKKFFPTLDYEKEMPGFFMDSKVNLNPALHAIRSGINLRALDIIGTGSFLLSSNLPEISEHFVVGEEIEVYSSLEECIEKAEFYIKNDSLREKIARCGFEKAEKEFRFEDRIREMFK